MVVDNVDLTDGATEGQQTQAWEVSWANPPTRVVEEIGHLFAHFAARFPKADHQAILGLVRLATDIHGQCDGFSRLGGDLTTEWGMKRLGLGVYDSGIYDPELGYVRHPTCRRIASALRKILNVLGLLGRRVR